MLRKGSLRYRIVFVIFCVEAVVMAGVLWSTTSSSIEENRRLLDMNDTVLVDLIASFSRVALFTGEYDDLQPYVEQVVDDPHIKKILLINQADKIVASSDVTVIGNSAPEFFNTTTDFWRVKSIDNASGPLGKLAVKFSHAELLAANRRVLDQGVIIAVFGMIVVAVIGFVSGYYLTRRLEKLNRAAQKMAEGKLDVSANVDGSDEIALLGRAFEKMAGSIREIVADLRRSQEELRRAHDDLELKVLERTSELAVARDEAMAASKAKGAFIANMSHELRTPLNAVIGYSEMLMEDIQDSDTESDKPELQKIHHAATHLLSLINDILDISKIEAGKMALHVETFSVSSLVNDVVSTVRSAVESNRNKLTIDTSEDLGEMTTDATKLRQTLLNLLSNAGKFTQDGTVKLRVRRQHESPCDWLHVDVEDTGIGIAATHVDRLFKEFSQVDESSTRRYGGTGLGLAISRQLCSMVGGDIEVASELNKGSTFSVRIPYVLPANLVASPVQA